MWASVSELGKRVWRLLPPARRAYCLGLASVIDRYGLPVSLGRLTRDSAGVGRVAATILVCCHARSRSSKPWPRWSCAIMP